MSDWIDIGHEHSFSFTANAEGERIGLLLRHPVGPRGSDVPPELQADPGFCLGGCYFDGTAWAGVLKANKSSAVLWQVQRMEPLTISPSVACSCGDHGFIQNGQWVPA